MEPIEIISQDVFDKIRSRFSNLMMGDKDGMKTDEPKDARIFDFDFAIEGASLGRVSISINELGSLKVFFSQGITENLDPIVQDLWYDFLKEMRFFAKRFGRQSRGNRRVNAARNSHHHAFLARRLDSPAHKFNYSLAD
jgi:hypothetical protein